MNIPLDETMSQEPAFTGNGEAKEDVFQFDEPVKEETPTDSQSESEQEQEDTPTSQEENKGDVEDATSEEEEQRVPYSRFKSKVAEIEERDSIIKGLEERLQSLEQSRIESKPTEEITVPQEWVELYGDSEASKRAFKIQVQREEQLMENATKKAIEQLKQETQREAEMARENELIIEDNLSSLQKSIGKKLTQEVEEAVLEIVDEKSPLDENGKYQFLFPFDAAYEIYLARNAKVSQKTTQARTQVANLTGNSSEGETESGDSNFKRGWDNWREAL